MTQQEKQGRAGFKRIRVAEKRLERSKKAGFEEGFRNTEFGFVSKSYGMEVIQ